MPGRRGRPELTADARRFREEIARELRAVVASGRLTVRAAAGLLGVSRQAFYLYLSAKATPHPETIARAMELWNIQPIYKGERITKGAFARANQPLNDRPAQLSLMNLLDVAQECHNERIVVTLKGSLDSTLRVTIKMKKAERPGGEHSPVLKTG